MSSPVLAITDRSAPSSSCSPAASLAPPVPPASRATFTRSRPVVGVRQPRDADPGVGLVAGVDRDQHRRQLLDDAGHLQRPGVDRAQARRSARSARRPAPCPPCGRRRSARPRRARRRGRRGAGALTVCRAAMTVTPSGTISWACWAADPCQTPSERVALPLTAAASGTVQSTRICPRAARPQVVEVLRLGAEGDGEEDDLAARGGLLVHEALDLGARARPRAASPPPPPPARRSASRSRPARPACAQRMARPAPSAPVPPMIGIGAVLAHGGHRASRKSPRMLRADEA